MSDIRETIKYRFSLILWAFILLGVFAMLYILYLMTFRREYYGSIQNTVKPAELPAERGDIYDAKGRLLVTSIYKYTLRFDPLTEYLTDERFYGKIDSLSIGLSQILGDSASYYKQKFIKARNEKKRGILFARNVTYWQLQKIKKLPLFNKGKYRGGLIVEKVRYRKLLNGDLARRTLGIKGNNNNYFGIEKIENKRLQGVNGSGIVANMGSGYKQILNVIQKPQRGDDVVVTIDLDLQDIVDKELRKQLKNLDAEAGVAILMEVSTGKIRAVANLSMDKDSNYREITNIAATELYEPGSVMKLASFICDFEEDPNLTLDTKVNTGDGFWRISPNFYIKDYNYKSDGTGGFGTITAQRVFEVSSNVGTATLAWNIFKNKPEKFVQKYADLGFDKPLDLGFFDEPMPTFSHPGDRTWSGVSVPQMSIGYEISITPYHIIKLYNAIANNGKMLKPMFVEKIIRDGKVVKTFEPTVEKTICSQRTVNYCKTMLEGVVENGTGEHYVKSDKVKIAGKSGTAQINQKNAGYKSDSAGIQYNTTFVAYFPADKPKYTCLVWIRKPKRHKSGSMAAGVVVKNIAEDIYAIDYDLHKKEYVVNNLEHKYLTPFVSKGFDFSTYPIFEKMNIPFKAKGKKIVKAKAVNDSLLFTNVKIERGKMPDVTGMNIKDAMFILGNMGLRVNFKGSGIVKRQSLKVGTNLKQGQRVTLTLG